MKNIEEKIKKIVHLAKKLFIKKSYEKSGIRPEKDWQVILSVFFAGLVASGALAFYFYTAVQNGTLWSSSSNSQLSPVHIIDQKNLAKITDFFNQKESNLSDLQNNKAKSPDPSL